MKNIYGQELGTEVDPDSVSAIAIHTRYEIDVGEYIINLCGTHDDIWFATTKGGRIASVGDMLFIVHGLSVAEQQLRYLYPDHAIRIDNMELTYYSDNGIAIGPNGVVEPYTF